MPSLKDPKLKLVYHPSAIANVFSKYYADLYNLHSDDTTPQPTDGFTNAFLESVKLPKVDATMLLHPNSAVDEKEIFRAIQSLPSNKSPGAGGFSAEYYSVEYSTGLLTLLRSRLKHFKQL